MPRQKASSSAAARPCLHSDTYTDRFDLIHLKLFAALDQGPGRHTSDLMKLAPTEDEMFAAARWVLTQDAGESFPVLVKDALTQLGFPHVSASL